MYCNQCKENIKNDRNDIIIITAPKQHQRNKMYIHTQFTVVKKNVKGYLSVKEGICISWIEKLF